jgi:phage replication initiation protein
MSEISPHSNKPVFTLTMDWLAFTLPDASVHDVMKMIGGEWSRGKAGFRGYPLSWILADPSRGVGLLGTGAPRRPREVHVDLSAGIVSSWELTKVRTILQWVVQEQGHFTRVDCALDDRRPLVPLSLVTQAAEMGQCITRADRVQVIRSFSLHKGTTAGETIYFGSPQSQTLLRVYDKRLELLAKQRPHADEFGIRWELEFKQDRADLCGQFLGDLEEADWLKLLIGLLRSYVDFRDTTRDAEDEERACAPRLPWYESLTMGFKAGRLTLAQEEPDEARVKNWITRSVAPMLAALCALPGGQTWMESAIVEGADRWKQRHRQLVTNGRRKKKDS